MITEQDYWRDALIYAQRQAGDKFSAIAKYHGISTSRVKSIYLRHSRKITMEMFKTYNYEPLNAGFMSIDKWMNENPLPASTFR